MKPLRPQFLKDRLCPSSFLENTVLQAALAAEFSPQTQSTQAENRKADGPSP
jgi:hypothetical protein